MATDPFTSNADSVTAPSAAPFAIIPSDTVEIPTTPKALYIGGAGTIVLRGGKSTSDVTFKGLAAGQVLEVRALFVRATGTTATDIVGLA